MKKKLYSKPEIEKVGTLKKLTQTTKRIGLPPDGMFADFNQPKTNVS